MTLTPRSAMAPGGAINGLANLSAALLNGPRLSRQQELLADQHGQERMLTQLQAMKYLQALGGGGGDPELAPNDVRDEIISGVHNVEMQEIIPGAYDENGRQMMRTVTRQQPFTREESDRRRTALRYGVDPDTMRKLSLDEARQRLAELDQHDAMAAEAEAAAAAAPKMDPSGMMYQGGGAPPWLQPQGAPATSIPAAPGMGGAPGGPQRPADLVPPLSAPPTPGVPALPQQAAPPWQQPGAAAPMTPQNAQKLAAYLNSLSASR